MADATVAVDGLKALQVLLKFAAKVTLYEDLLRPDRVDNGVQLFRRKILRANVRVDVCGFENFFCVAGSDAVDVRQRSFDAFVAGNVNTEKSGHKLVFVGVIVCLALTLFVARVGADDAENILPLDDAAAFALPFYRCSDFHDSICEIALVLEDKKSPGEPLFFSFGTPCAI